MSPVPGYHGGPTTAANYQFPDADLALRSESKNATDPLTGSNQPPTTDDRACEATADAAFSTAEQDEATYLREAAEFDASRKNLQSRRCQYNFFKYFGAIALIAVNALAWTGHLSTMVAATTNLSIIGVQTLTSARLAAHLLVGRRQAKNLALQALAFLCIGAVTNALGLAGILRTSTLGQIMVGCGALQILTDVYKRCGECRRRCLELSHDNGLAPPFQPAAALQPTNNEQK